MILTQEGKQSPSCRRRKTPLSREKAPLFSGPRAFYLSHPISFCCWGLFKKKKCITARHITNAGVRHVPVPAATAVPTNEQQCLHIRFLHQGISYVCVSFFVQSPYQFVFLFHRHLSSFHFLSQPIPLPEGLYVCLSLPLQPLLLRPRPSSYSLGSPLVFILIAL